jgi:hypothetical protein
VAAEAMQKQADTHGLDARLYDIGALVLSECIEFGSVAKKTREELNQEELGVMVWWGKRQREIRGEFYWLRKLEEKIQSESPDVKIIPNVRYLNEAKWVQENDGINVRVTSLNLDGSQYTSPDRDPNHPSETELLSYNTDYHLTVKRGDPILLADLAATLFERVWRLRLN